MIHTPGPWREDAGREMIIGPNGEIIVWELGTNEADARLIETAPELLKTLDDMYEHAEWSTPQGEAAFKTARLVIAKARGGK